MPIFVISLPSGTFQTSYFIPAPVTEGGRYSYWLYPIKFTDYDAVKFVNALGAEKIPFAWGYTVNPIYLCTDALTKQRTFGQTSYPFNSEYYPHKVEYKEGLCPVAERELKMLGTLRIYESWSKEDIDDIAKAIRKVAKGLKGSV